MSPENVDVVVIGAGQAGLSAAYHLRRRGYTPPEERGERTFVVLDADAEPGGAWQHRWASLHMATVNGIHELPGFPVPPADPNAQARDVLPRYFAAYEDRFDLRVRRPVRVQAVRRVDADPQGRLLVETDHGSWSTRYVINATGTWTQPYWPYVAGRESFDGVQLHTHDYVSRDAFAGKRVVIVGGGVSATQLLNEIADVAADVFWVTRREPDWQRGEWTTASRIEALDGVEQRVREGLPPGSVISVTGDRWTPWVQSAQEKGVLVHHPMFTSIEPDGVRMPDGTLHAADVILWATGFRPAIAHLAPLGLRTPAGGLRVENGRSIDEPRLFLIGYGPSQSTIGANRAGRDAVRAIARDEAAEPVPVG
ncbi:FAD-dependent oxidoreductase [Microbacterium gorillae]|uniref:FAD-dependent oxidoreductase n=1 Tax=Microbacterium gorillae TaxID=1231063 RepID=UPI00058BABDF|nr:FAD-dependent oxidoreductase [Microbacterium gorillae]